MITLCFVMVFTACNKEDLTTTQDLINTDLDERSKEKEKSTDAKKEKDDEKWEKIEVSPIVKTDDCDYPISGIIEYVQAGVVVATLDYGDGTCDDLVTITKDGTTEEISLNEKDQKKNKTEKDSKADKTAWTENEVSPVVKTEDCDYPVSGIIEYVQAGVVVATLDYGDGTCDDLATITKDGNTEEISLSEKDKKDEKWDKDEKEDKGEKDKGGS